MGFAKSHLNRGFVNHPCIYEKDRYVYGCLYEAPSLSELHEGPGCLQSPTSIGTCEAFPYLKEKRLKCALCV